MLTLKKAQQGFTLIEVVAAAALLGLMVTMAMPSLNAANAKVKDNRLKADLATVDQAIQLYVIDEGKFPAKLDSLSPNYITKISEIKDAKNQPFTYTSNSSKYNLIGSNTAGDKIYSAGSAGSDVEITPDVSES